VTCDVPKMNLLGVHPADRAVALGASVLTCYYGGELGGGCLVSDSIRPWLGYRVCGGIAALESRLCSGRPSASPRYPGLAGGLWLCRILVLSLFQAVVVPSGCRISVQPQRWITTW
jgi:hypothetical protein